MVTLSCQGWSERSGKFPACCLTCVIVERPAHVHATTLTVVGMTPPVSLPGLAYFVFIHDVEIALRLYTYTGTAHRNLVWSMTLSGRIPLVSTT